eukprot:scaffold143827_cov127-Phaeocystis_antarctica.AAC.1
MAVARAYHTGPTHLPLRCTARSTSLLPCFLASSACLPTYFPLLLLEVMRHTADFSFDEIVNAARVPRSASHNPLSQTSCTYHAAQTIKEDRAAYESAT